MSTSIIGGDSKITGQNEIDFVECDCCGLTEECTLSYIETVRERYKGKWICGLCSEAVNDEVLRCEKQKLISPDEAMARHFSFCNKFRFAGPPPDPTQHLITAIRHVLRKSLESPKLMRSMPSSPSKNVDKKLAGLTLSESCIPSLSLVDASVCCGMDEDCE
ncbi:unnamed protein product [Fraxinus pennsylvanica]|uniref:DUF1677 family protein n=1 Tax=Fraxinus pennsylvanica TaxID=56036 RepID=A0AAD2DW17_9LAMI|nr:unnamed protein product [Fraxinus pennsylvanica]